MTGHTPLDQLLQEYSDFCMSLIKDQSPHKRKKLLGMAAQYQSRLEEEIVQYGKSQVRQVIIELQEEIGRMKEECMTQHATHNRNSHKKVRSTMYKVRSE